MKTNLLKVFFVLALGIVILTPGLASTAAASSYSFSAAQVKSVMLSYGAPLSDSTNLWGLWAVRTMPIVTGGTYTIDSGATTQTGWGVSTSSFGMTPYTATNNAWFWDASGSEQAGTAANPLYMIMNQPASSFESNAFNTAGVWVGTYPTYTEATGANIVTAVNDSSTFTVNFTLDSGATWNGAYQFVVDGSRYTAGTTPAPWNTDFFGGYHYNGGVLTDGGDLSGNMVAGYAATPLPGSILLLGSGILGLVGLGWRVRKS